MRCFSHCMLFFKNKLKSNFTYFCNCGKMNTVYYQSNSPWRLRGQGWRGRFWSSLRSRGRGRRQTLGVFQWWRRESREVLTCHTFLRHQTDKSCSKTGTVLRNKFLTKTNQKKWKKMLEISDHWGKISPPPILRDVKCLLESACNAKTFVISQNKHCFWNSSFNTSNTLVLGGNWYLRCW